MREEAEGGGVRATLSKGGHRGCQRVSKEMEGEGGTKGNKSKTREISSHNMCT